LIPHSLAERFIAQSYDGVAVFSGENGVQDEMREIFAHANFIHA
jgi:hypothetical protein